MRTILRTTATLIILLLMCHTTWAQKKLYLCSDYTYSGEPMEASAVWNIPNTGGAVYIVYKNDAQKITAPRLYLFIDKLSGSDYKQYDSKVVITNKYLDWALYDYTFTEPGSYRFTLRNDQGVDQAQEYCVVNMEGQPATTKDITNVPESKTQTPTTTSVSSDYYIGSKILFCEDVDVNGKPIKPADVFNIGTAGGYLYVLVNVNKPVKTSQLIVDVWTGSDYKEPVETQYIDADPNSNWVKFKYILKNAGNYKFSIFNKDQNLIEAGYLTVNVK